MITRTEYSEANSNLQQLATRFETAAANQLVKQTNLTDSIETVRKLSALYHGEYEELLSSSLAKAGVTAAAHYNTSLAAGLSTSELSELVKEQILRQDVERYYGATLSERVSASKLMQETRIKKSAQVGASLETRQKNLSRVFNKPYPFGAQVNLDQRILLGQLVKLEHDIGLAIAKKTDIRVVKWTLSHKHTKKDICDALATDVDPKVVKWLNDNQIKISAKGLYFIEKVPNPPHPNCQCHLQMLKDKELRGGRIRRTLRRLRELLGNLG